MPEDDSDSKLTLSRRKALAGLGTIGAATAAGGFATYAQFTDNEDVDMTFSTGEIDGALSYAATYNGQEIKSMGAEGGSITHPHVKEGAEANGVGAGANLKLNDLKPGDYGSILFKLEVQTNPAWVINCLGQEGTVTEINYGEYDGEYESWQELIAACYSKLLGRSISSTDWAQGNLGDLLMVIPFYDEDPMSTFFDSGGPGTLDAEERYGVGSPGAFWANEQEDLNPLFFNQARSASGVQTTLWPDGDVKSVEPGDLACDTGCYLLHGQMSDLTGGESSDNTPDEDAAPLQPGDTMYFGYDWHLPWEVGNYAESVTYDFDVGFSFVQERHSAGSTFSNMYQYEPDNANNA